MPSANLDSRNNNPNNFYNSYLAIKNAANDSEIRRLFESREFVSRLAINDTARNSESDIILMQSILMHNPSALEHLKSLELDEEHDLKRQQIIKNVAIASLVNPNLHAKAKIILQDFSPEKFDDFDFENIQKSLLFLCAGIKYSAYKQSEDTLKFDILKKVLPFYHEKFDQRLNIQFRLPTEIIDALKLSIKSFSFKIDEERASSIPIDHDQYHKLFCGSDAIIEVNKAMILKALSRKDETIDPESSISPTNHYPVITNPVVQQIASPRQPSSTIYSSRRTENEGNSLRASTRNYRCVIS